MTEHTDWWREHDNIVTLAYWMRDNGHDVDAFVVMIEKPWKYTDEYEQAVADNAAEEAAAVASTQATESPLFPKLILVKDDMPGHPHNPAVFPLAWEPPVEVKLERCIHCGKVLHREMFDGQTFLVDDETGGDVCGSYGTFGNEPHVSDVAS